MRSGPRSRSSCGRSSARATSWRSSPTRDWGSSSLNAMPKRSFLSENSSRITPQKVSKLLAAWHDALAGEAILKGESINLDFHSVPYVGEHPLGESHYLSKRSRRQPSILTFLAQDADSQVFCYSNADIRKGEEPEEIFRFIKFWTRQHGKAPQYLVFDSKQIGRAHV